VGKLTDIQIRAWLKAGKPLAKTDGDGLTFTLSTNGTAAWVLRFRMGGKQREKTIGRFPDISLKRARELATENRAKIQQGVDVAREKQIAIRDLNSAWSIKELATDYEEKVLPSLAASTILSRKQKIRDYVLPAIGNLAAKGVTGSDVVEMLERVADKSPKLVKSVLSATRLIFAHGIAKHVVTSDPSAGISVKAIAGIDTKTGQSRVMLSETELRLILPKLADYGRINELVIRILLLTAQRIQALMLTEWEHVNFTDKTWIIPPGDGRKSDRQFIVPLTDVVVGYFAELKLLAGLSKFVLPIQKLMKGREGDGHMRQQTINNILKRLCVDLNGKVRSFTPHDLRSTARSHLSVLGVNVVVAERCLNHSLGGLLAIYDVHDYLDERRNALELWSTKLAMLEK
jgi:integrase